MSLFGMYLPVGLLRLKTRAWLVSKLACRRSKFAAVAVYVGDAEGDTALAKDSGIVAVGRLTGDN
jgi:hypothetical protein